MWFVLPGANTHVPKPATSATITVTAAVRARPPSAIVKPRIRNGTVLPIRWPQPACRNGASAMPGRPSTSRGWMPSESRPAPMMSTTSSAHMTTTIPMTSVSPRMRSSATGERVGDAAGAEEVETMAGERLRGRTQVLLKSASDRRSDAGRPSARVRDDGRRAMAGRCWSRLMRTKSAAEVKQARPLPWAGPPGELDAIEPPGATHRPRSERPADPTVATPTRAFARARAADRRRPTLSFTMPPPPTRRAARSCLERAL